METFSTLLAICVGNGEFTGPRWIPRKKASDTEEAGDLRRHRAHYDVTVMVPLFNLFYCVSSE